MIKIVAKICQESLRQHDYIGRVGGEEFLVILGSTHIGQALVLVEELRSKVEQCIVELPKAANISVTISIGVAQLDSDETADEIIFQADQALYQSKRTGKNKVTLYQAVTAVHT